MKATDFEEGDGWCLELVRSRRTQELSFLLYQGEEKKLKCVESFDWQGETFVPPRQDEILRHVRFANQWTHKFFPASQLLQLIHKVLSACLDLEEDYRFLLSCFVMSTWMIDRLPIAPYVALVGPPGSGKTMALKVLHQLCRRGLLTFDISSAAFYRACDQVTPTLFIDETATAGQPRTLFHLLRSGTTRDVIAFREKRSYRTFGAKVVAWPELPDDEALNSRCIMIPMHETSRTDLRKADDPEVIEATSSLSAALVRYRLAKRTTLSVPSLPGVDRLRSRMRDLFGALALAIGEDAKACARLLECLERQENINQDPLPANQCAVIGALYKQIHQHPDETTLLNLELTKEANRILAASGERLRMTWRAVGTVVKSHGFFKKRTKQGWTISLDRATRKRIHDLRSRYGIDLPEAACPSPELEQACEFCVAPAAAPSEVSPSNGSAGSPPAPKAASPPLAEQQNPEKKEKPVNTPYHPEPFEDVGDASLRDQIIESIEREEREGPDLDA